MTMTMRKSQREPELLFESPIRSSAGTIDSTGRLSVVHSSSDFKFLIHS